MITIFQESSCGRTEIAKSVGDSQISSISVLIADSSSPRVFACFFNVSGFSVKKQETTAFGYPARAHVEQRV
jgi:hypothetical protein